MCMSERKTDEEVDVYLRTFGARVCHGCVYCRAALLCRAATDTPFPNDSN